MSEEERDKEEDNIVIETVRPLEREWMSDYK